MSPGGEAAEAAALLLEARRTGRPLERLPARLRPADIAGAYAIQARVHAALGRSGVWKVSGGPPAAVYLLSRRPTKTEYQATTVLVFWVLNIAKAVPYAGLGLFSAETLKLDLILAPFALFGTWAGVRLHHSIPERVFFALAYVLLTVTGVKLIWDGLT